ncbi:MAG TPA: Rieske (2Fe-2S) protein [candidate division Zixibacteria bacterium]|nr:Rieske (2Fe-2S) protein [candidate division Zixibacteria bacterium]
MSEELPVNKRSFFQRLFGKCITALPENDNCFTVEGHRVTIDLEALGNLPNGAVRLEGNNLPVRLLIIRDQHQVFHVFENACTHGKRRMDPVFGHDLVQCCSVGRSTFDLEGHRLSGSAKLDIKKFPAEQNDGKLIVNIG